MTDFLAELTEAGLIQHLDGDDGRFERIARASQALSEGLKERPQDIVQAILAGLDPDVPVEDPAITQAKQALVAEWKTMGSVYPSPPVSLFRAILLDACYRAAEGTNAAIAWLSASDSFRWMCHGKEEPVIAAMLEDLARRTESLALKLPKTPLEIGSSEPGYPEDPESSMPEISRVNRTRLRDQIAAAAGPNYRNTALENANSHWSNQPQHWSWEFADHMHATLADELDRLAQAVEESQDALIEQERKFTQQAMASAAPACEGAGTHRELDHNRLSALWWSEALYSPSLRRSYRELPSDIAAVTMAFDLLSEISLPAPASVGYLLAESVNRLERASFNKERALSEHLRSIGAGSAALPATWIDVLSTPPKQGRLSLRDLVVLAITGAQAWGDEVLGRTGIPSDAKISLPSLAHAMFRQEQALQLARPNQ